MLRSRFKKIQDANAGSRFADRIEAQGFLDTGHRTASAVKHEAKQGSHPHMQRDAALSSTVWDASHALGPAQLPSTNNGNIDSRSLRNEWRRRREPQLIHRHQPHKREARRHHRAG